MSYLFTSESVSEGHPDKVCDCISDSLVDLFLNKDNYARCAIETLATTNRIIISGETSCNEYISKEEIENTVRQAVRNIGYDQKGFSWQTVQIDNYLHHQSADIALGVDIDGAGDQGIMFGYAKKEQGFDSEYMPLAIYLSNQILKNLSFARHNGEVPGIEPDAKSQVTLEYDNNGKPVAVKTVVLSTQHSDKLSQEEVRHIAKQYIARTLPEGWMPEDKNILINPTGRFVIGGPDGDTGLTGRKIIVDNYGGYAPHGGGAFSGKDATKVDRSAAYMLRYLAKNIVAAGLADECLLQVSYAIGIAEPLSLYIDCRKTNKVDEKKILDTINEMVSLTPKNIITKLNLRRPIYTPTAAYGHFGRQPQENGCFSWEKLDLAEQLKKCF
ncbi:MAG: methionine adenosyltransferase [Alphaproteobacteria bacterium]|nr:methionine adenosyltransferase [Alphaproteobacteria bacterium]